MEKSPTRSKIINDPVHGFIEVPKGTLLQLIDTPDFQRLRRIKQLGQSSLVYPGAVHTRFNHALGAMHLMRQALDTLRLKDVPITDSEYEGALIAILLHDIGHGPFSHALEYAIIKGLHHEDMSLAMMHNLNKNMDGKLSTAIDIFTGKHQKKFLHQLVSSQLDMDRMDYLIRDSFFTGVVEGVVGIDRIIKVLNVWNGQLVCEDKGIYSVEKFVVARRLMYWQVYLHKAAMSAEHMMVNILSRARELVEKGENIFLDDTLEFFFRTPVSPEKLNKAVIEKFIQMDDINIEFALKQWQSSNDRVLSDLCSRILSRKLLKVRFDDKAFSKEKVKEKSKKFRQKTGFSAKEASYYVFKGKISNQAYLKNSSEPILIYFKNGKVKDLATASDMNNIRALSAPVTKHFLCFPGNKGSST